MVSTPCNLTMTHRVHTFKNIKLHYNACNIYFKPNCKLMKGQKMSKQNIIHCISHSFCGALSTMKQYDFYMDMFDTSFAHKGVNHSTKSS